MGTISVCTWYDSVTPESLEDGEYHSTKNDFRCYEFTTEEMAEAAEEFAHFFNENNWLNSHSDYVNNIYRSFFI